jgi:hypothetical protein
MSYQKNSFLLGGKKEGKMIFSEENNNYLSNEEINNYEENIMSIDC